MVPYHNGNVPVFVRAIALFIASWIGCAVAPEFEYLVW